jgi:hypothetical protein
MWLGRGRQNFRAPQAVPLGLQGPDGMDRQAVGDQLSAIENLQRRYSRLGNGIRPFGLALTKAPFGRSQLRIVGTSRRPFSCATRRVAGEPLTQAGRNLGYTKVYLEGRCHA